MSHTQHAVDARLRDSPPRRVMRRWSLAGGRSDLEPARAASILEETSADERTDVIQKMGLHDRHRLLPKFSPEVRAELEDLLQYPDHTAGGIMTTEFVRLDPRMTVSEALKHIRSVAHIDRRRVELIAQTGCEHQPRRDPERILHEKVVAFRA